MLTVDAPEPLDGARLRQELEAAGLSVTVNDVTLTDGVLVFDTLGEADRDTVEAVVGSHTGEPTREVQARQQRTVDLEGAISTLRQWSDDAAATDVTQDNAVQVLDTVVTRLGVFFDRFADLLDQRFPDAG